MANYNSLYTQYLMDKHGVAWFKFDETIATSLVDSKGSNVGTVIGTSIVSGINGNARSFNGTSDYIRFANNYLIPTGKKSVRIRFRASSVSTTSNRYLFSNFDVSTTQQGFGIFITPTGNLTVVGANATSSLYRYNLTTLTSVCDNIWHDILFTWDGTTSLNSVKLYVDDMYTPVSQTTSSSIEPDAYYAVGSSIGRLGGNASTSNLQCELDSFEIYNDVIEPFFNKMLFSSNNKYYSINEELRDQVSITSIMTNNTSPSGIASASNFFNATYDAWKAFDGIASSSWQSASGFKTGYVSYRFPNKIIISKYSIVALNSSAAATAAPKSWAFEGSNDGINWDILDSQFFQIGWIALEKRIFSFNNNKNYQFYRVNITENNGHATAVTIAEIEMFEKLLIFSSIDEYSENFIMKYGADQIPYNSNIKIQQNIISYTSSLGLGKKFEHSINFSKRKINKITLN